MSCVGVCKITSLLQDGKDIHLQEKKFFKRLIFEAVVFMALQAHSGNP